MLKRQARKRIGDLLLESKKITEDQLSKALEIQKKAGGKLGDILVREEFINEAEIIKVLQLQLGVPYIDLKSYILDTATCLLIPENIARRYGLIPVKNEDGVLTVAMSDPLNVFAIDDVRIFSGLEVKPAVSTMHDISTAIDKYYSAEKAIQAAQEFKREKDQSFKIMEDEQDITSNDEINNAPAVKLVNSVIDQAARNRVSDIHIEPFEDHIKIRFRRDGQLYEVMKVDVRMMQAISARIKIVGGMNIAEKRLPQEGRINILIDKKELDLRFSVLPVMFGEKIVIRVIDKDRMLITKDKLGFTFENLVVFESMILNPHGIILVTGPTGSGKTSTLYSALHEINRPDLNIITIEDPIESRIEGINQVQLNTKAGLTFASGLKSILRQDPDVIMLGEIRDNETAQIAIRASITGHLVLSTMHTNDSAGAVSRLLDMGLEPFMVASAIIGVVAQRLVKRICEGCKEQYLASDKEIRLLGMDPNSELVLYKGEGCPSCNGTGYLERIGVFELMVVTKKHREAINNKATEEEIRSLSIGKGMLTLKETAKQLVLKGDTTIKEFLRLSHTND